MTPEADRYLDKARQSMAHARTILAIELGEDAGRAAYPGPSMPHKPSSSSEPTGCAKTHRGVHGQFLKLVEDEPRIDVELRRFLSEGYKLKAIADYETGPDAVVPLEQAATAVETAGRFIQTIAEMLG